MDPLADGLPHPELEGSLTSWESREWEVGARLPYHLPTCHGCGPRNPAGLGLVAHVDRDTAVRGTITFDERFQGAVGVVHGGALATAFDDLFGFVLVRIAVPAVTRDLTVRYEQPVRLGVGCEMHARLDDREGHHLHLSAELTQRGEVRARSEAVFVEVHPTRLTGEGDTGRDPGTPG